MSVTCSTFSLANLNENVFLEVSVPSEQCVAAASLAAYFFVCLTMRVSRLTYTIYRVILYFRTTSDWRALVKNQELVIQTLHSMLGIASDTAFLSGYRTTGYALGTSFIYFGLMPIFIDMYPKVASIAKQLESEQTPDYYKQDVRFVVCFNLIQTVFIIITTIYYRRREIINFKITYMTHIVTVFISSIWIWWRVRQATLYCEKLVTGHEKKIEQTRIAMTGINQSLVNGEGDSFAETLAHSKAINDSCKKLYMILKGDAIGYGAYTWTFLPTTIVILAVTWNHPDGVSYFNYVLYTLSPATALAHRGASRLARPPKPSANGKAKDMKDPPKDMTLTKVSYKTQLTSV